MKKLLFVIFSVLCSTTLFSQLRLGAQGGYNHPQVSPGKSSGTVYTHTTSAYKGFQVGIVAEAPFTQHWSYRTGLVINGKGTRLEKVGMSDTNSRFIELHYLEVPLYLIHQWKAGKDWSVLASMGGYVARAVRGMEKGKGKSLGGPYYIYNKVEFRSQNPRNTGHPTIINPFDYGFSLSAGVAHRSGQLWFSYSQGLQRIFPKSLDFEDKFTNKVFSISVACFMD